MAKTPETKIPKRDKNEKVYLGKYPEWWYKKCWVRKNSGHDDVAHWNGSGKMIPIQADILEKFGSRGATGKDGDKTGKKTGKKVDKKADKKSGKKQPKAPMKPSKPGKKDDKKSDKIQAKNKVRKPDDEVDEEYIENLNKAEVLEFMKSNCPEIFSKKQIKTIMGIASKSGKRAAVWEAVQEYQGNNSEGVDDDDEE